VEFMADRTQAQSREIVEGGRATMNSRQLNPQAETGESTLVCSLTREVSLPGTEGRVAGIAGNATAKQ
jgi:hypothetical protein